MTVLPLPAQIPGGPELLVIALIGLLVFGLPLVLLAGGYGLWKANQSSKDERIAELEQKVEEFERERAADRGDGGERDADVDGGRERAEDRVPDRATADDGE